jgi:hypothetical protein
MIIATVPTVKMSSGFGSSSPSSFCAARKMRRSRQCGIDGSNRLLAADEEGRII